jgi:hypothetical protein
MPGLHTAATPPSVHRISGRSQVFTFRPHRGSPVHRWDDPLGVYGVLYASETLRGALIESLGDFRPSIDMIKEMESIELDDAPTSSGSTTLKNTAVRSGSVSVRYLGSLFGGIADIKRGIAAHVTHSASLAHIRHKLAPRLASQVETDLGADLVLARNRRFTQLVSRFVYEATTDDGTPYDAILCESYYGVDIVNVSLFSGLHDVLGTRATVDRHESRRLSADEPAVRAACAELGISIV